MKKVKATYEILTPISEGGIEELKHIERIGRVCYKSEDKITDDGESSREKQDNKNWINSDTYFCKVLLPENNYLLKYYGELYALLF